MLIEEGDIFDYNADVICIPINGNVLNCNETLMGTCLFQSTLIFPDVLKNLEIKNRLSPDYVTLLSSIKGTKLLSFPVKLISNNEPVERIKDKLSGGKVPPWIAKPSLDLIERSAYQISNYVRNNRIDNVVLPIICKRELDWEKEVKPILSTILDDRFTILY